MTISDTCFLLRPKKNMQLLDFVTGSQIYIQQNNNNNNNSNNNRLKSDGGRKY